MNLPNKITVFRACLIPIFLILMLVPNIPNGNWWALIIFIIASLSDFLDGYLARKNKLVTNFGKFMDPIADKLLVCSALICFVESGLVPAWIVIIIISREFIISGFKLVASDNGMVIAASFWAKIKTASQMVMCCFFIGNINNIYFDTFEQVILYISLALTIISMLDYMIKNRHIMNDAFSIK